jgi:hypothetical protein
MPDVDPEHAYLTDAYPVIACDEPECIQLGWCEECSRHIRSTQVLRTRNARWL